MSQKIFDINNTNFSLEVKEFINKILLDDNDWLKPHQRNIHDVFYHLPRGLLAYLKMGTGKTRLAVASALSSHLEVVLISNKALMGDFLEKIEKIKKALELRNIDSSDLDKFEFVSLNASNLLTQVERVGNPLETQVFDNKMIIVDEAHHFFNSITNQSKNALGLYRKILSAKNCKIMFLTGTPIVKDIWEMVPCFNMLAGFELLPENRDDFFTLYGEGRNRGKLENRLSGLIAYYEIPPELAKQLLPEVLDRVVVKVDMSKPQFNAYLGARSMEVEEVSRGQKSKNLYKAADKKFSSTYRAKSRRFSNFVYVPGFDPNKPKTGEIGQKIDPNDLTDKECEHMHIFSPKLVKMFDDITATKQDKQYCYSLFKDSGVYLMARYARFKGWKEVNFNNTLLNNTDSVLRNANSASGGKEPIGYYGILDGSMSIEDRRKIVSIFNEPDNRCTLLFITIVGSEGFDFKRSRYCRLFEYFFHDSAISQISGRGPRIESHIDMPPKDRTFQVYVYLTKVPDDYTKEISTDEYIFNRAIKGAIEPNEIMRMFQRISINCETNCKICSPTNKLLYYQKIDDDMMLEDPCIPPNQVKETVFEVDYNGEKYFYDKKKNIIRFDEVLNQYVYLNINDPLYHIIYNSIKDQ